MPRPLAIALYLAGRPWTVWVFGVLMISLARADGSGDFDAVIVAIGPTLLWAGFSFVCRMLTQRMDDPFRRSLMPAIHTLPKPQVAVVVAPHSADACVDAATSMTCLSPDLRCIVCKQVQTEEDLRRTNTPDPRT